MNRQEKQQLRMPDQFWEDWMLAVAGLKCEVEILPETLKRWDKEVAAWHDENDGKETV